MSEPNGPLNHITMSGVLRQYEYFGKKRPLTAGDFEPFESAFGSDPNGNAPRVSEGEGGRWRSYDRQAIADRSDNLDLNWLGGVDPAPEELMTEPEEVAAAIIGHLRNALADIQAVADELVDSSGAAQ